jgi:H+-transporting ATPase
MTKLDEVRLANVGIAPPTEATARVVVEAEAASAGLTSAGAEERLARYGPNAIAEASRHSGIMLLRKFWGVIPWMLEVAIVLDLALGRWTEAAIITGLLGFQAAMGFYQETRAKQALALLRQRLSVTTRVRRDGQWQTVPAAELVPDDLVHLRVGDIVPADMSLVDGTLSVDQSQLTGESLPVEAAARTTVYSGSLVRRGEATGVVTATGKNTYFGRTAELVQQAKTPGRMQQLTVQIAKYLLVLDIALVVIMVASAVVQDKSLSSTAPFTLMLLVAAVPIALPTMFTMSAALGARGLATQGVLATRLSAVEDAALMDVLCLDKTGTLTENHLAVEQLEPFGSVTSDEVLRLAALASDEATQDPIDLAVIQAARERGVIEALPPRLDFEPFDPSTKRSAVSVQENGQTIRVMKGEPSTVAALAKVPWSTLESRVAQLSSGGSRVLAVASGSAEQIDLRGLIAFADPPRADSANLIRELANHGVRVVLLTGDGEATARAVAAKVGIEGEVAPPGTIHENFDATAATRYSIFANVFPQEKFLLVKALQDAGHVVGMTGDGVNDAPALSQADVGIAVASATDVAKAAASLVLTKPGLGEIVTAVKVSRSIYQRMQTWVLAMITRKASIPPFLALGVLVFGSFVLNPTQVVLMMLLGDIATFALAWDRVVPSSKPNRWMVGSLAVTGAGLAVLLLAMNGFVFWLGSHPLDLSVGEAQTFAFVWLVFGAAQAALYTTRSRTTFWSKPYPGRGLIVASAFDMVLATVMATQGWLMDSISIGAIGVLLGLTAAFLVLGDVVKAATFGAVRRMSVES